jgi:hypothetical protein
MRKLRPREGIDLHDVVEELNELIRVLTYALHVIGLLDQIEVTADLLHAASSRPHNVIVALEVLDE